MVEFNLSSIDIMYVNFEENGKKWFLDEQFTFVS